MQRKHQQGWHTRSATASEKQVENEGLELPRERRSRQANRRTRTRAGYESNRTATHIATATDEGT